MHCPIDCTHCLKWSRHNSTAELERMVSYFTSE
jgi:hypothetical protein